MPSSYTPNYQLNQWSKDDQVKMEDFNADNAKTDAAIAAALIASPCAVGTYTGTGEAGTLELGFRPTVFIAWGLPVSEPHYIYDVMGGIAIEGGGILFIERSQNIVSSSQLRFRDYGMELTSGWPNRKDVLYSYIAIR